MNRRRPRPVQHALSMHKRWPRRPPFRQQSLTTSAAEYARLCRERMLTAGPVQPKATVSMCSSPSTTHTTLATSGTGGDIVCSVGPHRILRPDRDTAGQGKLTSGQLRPGVARRWWGTIGFTVSTSSIGRAEGPSRRCRSRSRRSRLVDRAGLDPRLWVRGSPMQCRAPIPVRGWRPHTLGRWRSTEAARLGPPADASAA